MFLIVTLFLQPLFFYISHVIKKNRAKLRKVVAAAKFLHLWTVKLLWHLFHYKKVSTKISISYLAFTSLYI